MTSTERNAIVTPRNGLLVYNSTDHAVSVRANGAWVNLGTGGGLSDADYGDIVVSSGGTVMTIDTDVVTNTKIATGAGGIYKGSGTIPANTVSTTTAASTFEIDYSSTRPAFKIDNTTASLLISGDSTNNTGLSISTTNFTVNAVNAASTNGTQISGDIFGSLSMVGGTFTLSNYSGQGAAPELRLSEPSGSGTNYTAFRAQAQAANLTYTLPASIVTNGYLQTDASGNLSWATITAGDVTGPASSVNNEIAVYNGTTGKVIQRATGTGVAIVTSGVLSTKTNPTGAFVGDTDSQTLTNKRIDPRVTSEASNSAPAPNVSTTDMYILTALAVNTVLGAPTGTPVQGQKLIYRIKDNGVARTIGYNAIYRAVGVTLPTTTVISKTLYLGMIYNATDARWDIIAVSQEA